MESTGSGSAGRARSRSTTLTFAIVVGGGVLGWTGVYLGLRGWGLLLGLGVTAVALVELGRRHRRSAGVIAGFAFAFLLLTWPLSWLAGGCARYLITGEPIDSD